MVWLKPPPAPKPKAAEFRWRPEKVAEDADEVPEEIDFDVDFVVEAKEEEEEEIQLACQLYF